MTRTIRVHSLDPSVSAFIGGVFGLIRGLAGGIFSLATLPGLAGLGGFFVSVVGSTLIGLFVGGIGMIIVNAVLRRVGGLAVEIEEPSASDATVTTSS